MANMSYCRFENTYNDFKDCIEALQGSGLDGLSESERKYAKRLIEAAKELAADFDEEEDEDGN